VRAYGHVGQVEPIFCNIRDDASVRAALRSADACVNCVGSFDQKGRNGMEAVQAEGAGRVARLSLEGGLRRMVHVSAIGADPASRSRYGRSKAAGEALVLLSMPSAVILRPSILFGAEDAFFNRFAAMAARGPVIPLVGAATRFQPAFVDDVAEAAAMGVSSGASGDANPGTFELGGPEVLTFRELMERMLREVRRRRLVLGLPFWAGSLVANLSGIGNTLTGGLAPQPITIDQVESLRTDNVVAPGARGFADLGLQPVALDGVLPEYLWRFRPSGQYAAIKESARNLRS
jgi:NADH dehydrogenase